MKALIRSLVIPLVGIIAFSSLGFYFESAISPYIMRIVVNAGIAIILALSLNLINGCAGQFSLGHAGFMAVGAYFSAYLSTVSPFASTLSTFPWVGIPMIGGGIFAAFVGYFVGLPSLRLRGDYLAIVTLGFGEIIRILILNFDFVGGARGLTAIPLMTSFYWVYFWVGVTFLSLFYLMKSKYGRAILATRENEIAAGAIGIDVSQFKVFAFVVSSFFAGIAGALFAHYQGFIDPNSFNFNRSVEIVIMVVLGGMGSFTGVILGALFVTVLPEALRSVAEYRMLIFSLLLIVVMLLRPQGLMGSKEIWQLIKRRSS